MGSAKKRKEKDYEKNKKPRTGGEENGEGQSHIFLIKTRRLGEVKREAEKDQKKKKKKVGKT